MTEHETLELILQKVTGLDEKVTGLDEKVTGLDEKVAGLDEKVTGLDEKVAGLDEKVIGLDKKVNGLENKVTGMETKVTNVENKVTGLETQVSDLSNGQDAIIHKMNENFTSSENMILKELDRVQEHLGSDVQKVQKNLEELQQYYRISKLENDNTSLLLKMYNDMQKEIAELKAKIA